MSIRRNSLDELAEKLADRILLDAIGSAASSGLLLTLPKDAEGAFFISDNLKAALKERGALVLYASLDGARSADSIISGLVCEAIQRMDGGAVDGADEAVNAAAALPEN